MTEPSWSDYDWLPLHGTVVTQWGIGMTAAGWTIIVAALVIIAVTGYLIWRSRQQITVSFGPDRESFMSWLREYEIWYTEASDRYYRLLTFCRVAPIFIGFAVAVVSALKQTEFDVCLFRLYDN